MFSLVAGRHHDPNLNDGVIWGSPGREIEIEMGRRRKREGTLRSMQIVMCNVWYNA